MPDRRGSRIVLIAIGVYCLWSGLLILQKPGLQYDEAFLVAGAVHMLHPAQPYNLAQPPDIWVCPFQYCVPLMGGGSRYVGAIKDYLALPLFALFGPRATVIRFISMLLGGLGIWGVSRLIAKQISELAAGAVAMIMALNPAYVAMTVFDNNAFAAMMAGFGLVCMTLAWYLHRRSVPAAFLLGATIGLSVWSRANFVWILGAGSIAALLVYRTQLRASAASWIAVLLGGVLGGFPFITYQLISGGGTWKSQQLLTSSLPHSQLLWYRLRLLRDTLMSDGEHRLMWGNPVLPAWQAWFFPAIAAIACLMCLVRFRDDDSRRAATQFTALTTIFLLSYLLFTRMIVAEHHLIVLIPFAAVVVVLASSHLLARPGFGRLLVLGLALIYVGSAIYWQIRGIEGLRRSGGVGVWSDSGVELARDIDGEYGGQTVKFLDWGFQANLYVLTAGRIKSEEIYSESEETTRQLRPWTDEIRDGGVFILKGSENHQFSKSSIGFLQALETTRPAVRRRYTVAQRNGATYAQIIEIEPNSSHGGPPVSDPIGTNISMGEAQFDKQLSGFYPAEGGNWRWTSRDFAVRLAMPYSVEGPIDLVAQLSVPKVVIQRLGPITLTARVGDHILQPETYNEPGDFTFLRQLTTDETSGNIIRVDFALDKVLAPTPPDIRELGIVVQRIAVQPR